MTVSTTPARNLFALLSFFLFLVSSTVALSPVFAQGQKPVGGYEEKKRQANDIAVTVVVSGISCTCARFAEDIRNVVNDLGPDGIRVLPVLGVGGLQNVNDVLFLKNIDMAVVDEDNLRLLKKKDPVLYANIEQRVQYITKLYNSEFHVLARNDIKSYDDLKDKKVNFNLKDSQTEVTADTVFDSLKIPVQRSYYDNDEAMKRASTVIEEAYADFRKVMGRAPENPWFEEYMTDDAEIILVGMGTISLPMKVGIRNMRAQGKKVGLIRPRWFRPFPTERLVKALSKASAIGVIDRDYSFGSPFNSGVVANEIRAAMYNADKRPPLLSFICGLGGREVTLEDVAKAADMCYAAAKAGKSDPKTHWLGVRE